MSRLNTADETLTEITQTQIQNLTKRINEVEKTKQAKLKGRSGANKKLLSESTNKYWCSWGKEKKPRDTIPELREPESNPPSYTSNTVEMAAIAAKHYNAVQHKDLVFPPGEREALMRATVISI